MYSMIALVQKFIKCFDFSVCMELHVQMYKGTEFLISHTCACTFQSERFSSFACPVKAPEGRLCCTCTCTRTLSHTVCMCFYQMLLCVGYTCTCTGTDVHVPVHVHVHVHVQVQMYMYRYRCTCTGTDVHVQVHEVHYNMYECTGESSTCICLFTCTCTCINLYLYNACVHVCDVYTVGSSEIEHRAAIRLDSSLAVWVRTEV